MGSIRKVATEGRIATDVAAPTTAAAGGARSAEAMRSFLRPPPFSPPETPIHPITVVAAMFTAATTMATMVTATMVMATMVTATTVMATMATETMVFPPVVSRLGGTTTIPAAPAMPTMFTHRAMVELLLEHLIPTLNMMTRLPSLY